jgi:tetratricopeptide (TPR) repeat protein
LAVGLDDARTFEAALAARVPTILPPEPYAAFFDAAIADACFAKGRRDDALNWYRSAAGHDPTPKRQARVARALLRLGRGDEVSRGTDAEASALIGEEFRQHGRLPDAIACYSDAHQSAESKSEYLEGLVSVLTAARRVEDALLAIAAADLSLRQAAMLKVCKELANQAHWPDALAILRDAWKKWPCDVDTAVPLAEALIRTDRWTEAWDLENRFSGAVLYKLQTSNAKVLGEVGRWEEARDTYKRALEIYPLVSQPAPDTKAAFGVTLAFARLEEWGDAERMVTKGLQTFCASPDLQAQYAQVVWKSGRHAEGLAMTRANAERALADPAGDHDGVMMHVVELARRLYQLGSPDDAIAVLSRGAATVSAPNDRATFYRSIGIIANSVGRFSDAVSAFRRALLACPDDSVAAMDVVNLLAFALGQTSEAIEAVEVVLDLDYVSGTVFKAVILAGCNRRSESEILFDALGAAAGGRFIWEGWGFALLQNKEFARAETKFRRAIEECHSDWGSRNDLATSLDGQGRHREAWVEWDRLSSALRESWLATKGTNTDVAQFYADVLLRLGDATQAKEVLESALDWAPFEVEMLSLAVNAEMALVADGDVAESEGLRRAVEWSARAKSALGDSTVRCARYPLVRERVVTVASAYVAIGNFDDALKLVNPMLSFDEDGRLHAAAAVAESRCDNHPRSVDLFRRSISLGSDDMETRTNLGDALRKADRLEEAEGEYQRVLRITSDSVDARLGLAETYVLMGDRDSDDDLYEQAIDQASQALKLGVAMMGSRRLSKRERAEVYYLMGYAWVKRQKAAESVAIAGSALNNAREQFRAASREYRDLDKAKRALAKIKRSSHATPDGRTALVGRCLVLFLAGVTFALAQISFFVETNTHRMLSGTDYSLVTFGALLFTVVGLYLPHILKLKVGSIELEKTAASEANTPSTISLRM